MQLFRHLFLIALIMSCGAMVFAQATRIQKNPNLMQPMPMTAQNETGLNVQNLDVPVQDFTPTSSGVQFRGPLTETIIGETIYDLQTNYSICNRFSVSPDGNLMATWTQGFTPTAYPERGTGYNMYDGGAWGAIPTERLEANVRTGWPNHGITNSGDELIVSHVFTSPEYRLHYLRRASGETDWTEADVPTSTTFGSLWPRMATGGSDGETFHIIAVATPVGNGGEIYEGVDAHLLYYRSQDGGETWDITDGIIPGLDSSRMKEIHNADSYSLSANGDNVAIGLFNQWGDIIVAKSEDNGDSWTTWTVHDFPLDKYEINSGYTVEDLPQDTLAPDSMAIFTSDNSGHVLIDNDGMVHAFFGEMYVQDANLTDAGWTYFPGTSGMAYWNENHGEDSIRTIVDVIDLNNNEVLDIAGIANIALYFVSLTGFPSAGVDADNNIYLAYTMVMETEEFYNQDDAQHYRHIYLTSSMDGGETWTEPYAAINEDVIEEPEFIPFIEAVFPTVNPKVGTEVEFIYQQDFKPGLITRGDEDEAATNLINYVHIPTSTFGVVNTEEPVTPETLEFTAAPNPTTGELFVSFELENSSSVSLDLYSLTGQQVARLYQATQLSAGAHRQELDLHTLPQGAYFLQLRTDKQVTSIKVMVE